MSKTIDVLNCTIMMDRILYVTNDGKEVCIYMDGGSVISVMGHQLHNCHSHAADAEESIHALASALKGSYSGAARHALEGIFADITQEVKIYRLENVF